MKSDKLSTDLLSIETQLDNLYKSNPLLALPFPTAAWHLLAAAGDDLGRMFQRGPDALPSIDVSAKEFHVDLEYPMYWLHKDCEQVWQVPAGRNYDRYKKAGRDLFEWGKKYASVVFTYTCANRGVFELELKGATIQPRGDFFKELEYQAYNDLVDFHATEEAYHFLDRNMDRDLQDAIEHSLKIKGDRFSYKWNPKLVRDMKRFLEPNIDRMFSLPSKWQFSSYSLGEFRKVFEAICAMAHIHWRAHSKAKSQGCRDSGYASSIFMPSCDRLLTLVVDNSGVSEPAARRILEDLTYGNRGIKRPDLALQPLVKIHSDYYAIAPLLWIAWIPEDNLIALLNKIPEEKKIYSKLSNEKEDRMREYITTELGAKGFRFIDGRVQNSLPDIDLAIIMDSEKAVLLLELKWFIAPASAYEKHKKSEEISKGVSQIQALRMAFSNRNERLLSKLKIDSSYRLEGAVISQNWIGYADVQSPEVPVIRSEHLIAKLKKGDGVTSAMEWLKNRAYLPKVDKDFTVDEIPIRIGDWILKAPAIVRDNAESFFPL